MRFQVDSAHSHSGRGVLICEGDAGDEAGVDDVRGAEVGEGAEVQDYGAGGEVVDLGLCESLGEEAVVFAAACCEVCFIAVLLLLGGFARAIGIGWWVYGFGS